jgi:hypothetical protein
MYRDLGIDDASLGHEFKAPRQKTGGLFLEFIAGAAVACAPAPE